MRQIWTSEHELMPMNYVPMLIQSLNHISRVYLQAYKQTDKHTDSIIKKTI